MINKNIIISVLLFILITSINISTSFADNSMYDLEAKKIIYLNNNKLIIAEGNASAKDQSGKKIFAEKITYDKDRLLITTEGKSTYKDEKYNSLIAENFIYDLNTKTIIANKNVKFSDKDGNVFNFKTLKYFEKLEKGYGENLIANLNDNSSIEGFFAEIDNKLGLLIVSENNEKSKRIFQKFKDIFKKKTNFYTPCKSKDNSAKTIVERCPDWHLETTKTIHDKNSKMVYHYGSVLKIKNIPVFYTPYFSHPDPSVKKKSGFLPPSIKNFTDLGQTFKIPYFFVIDDNRDLTFTPIYYFEENPIFLSTYRQQNTNSRFYLDSSYTKGYKKLNKKDNDGNLIQRTNGSRNHFFFNFLGNYDDLLFNNNDLEINIQRISQKNYLKVNQINTEYVKQDVTSLNNNVILNSYSNNKKLTVKSNIFENLNIEDKNTKYQYTLPSIEFSDYFKKFGQLININHSFSNQNLGGDTQQLYQNNKIETISETTILPFLDGLTNTFKTSVNNVNYYNQNINSAKENLNNNLYLTFANENSYPLIRFDKYNNEEIITPKIFSKFITGSNSNAKDQNNLLGYDQVFSMNRMNNVIDPETGTSLGYGINYDSTRKNLKNQIYSKTELSIGQVIRPTFANNDISSNLSESKSHFTGYANYTNNFDQDISLNYFDNSNYIKIKYDYIISNDLNKFLKNSLTGELTKNNNKLATTYYETHDISNEHYLDLKYIRKFSEDLSFSIGGRKNIQDKFTENNFIEANYETDCLKIAINLSKKFYQNEEIKPSNNLTLSLLLKPFGAPLSPDLSSFLN